MLPPQSPAVLLAEDDPADLKLALRAFRKHHLTSTVHIVRDGAEALEFLFRTGRYANRNGGPPHL